jgi:flavorubredoxin
MKAAIVYWSKTGNTEKVALAIKEGLEEAGVEVLFARTQEADDIDLFDDDLVCLGFPTYQLHPPVPMGAFIKRKFSEYREQGRVKLAAPEVPGRNALIFCTHSGPHAGINEAILFMISPAFG